MKGDRPRDDVQFGIVSWGNRHCAQPDQPTVFTRVSHFWPNISAFCCHHSQSPLPPSWNCDGEGGDTPRSRCDDSDGVETRGADNDDEDGCPTPTPTVAPTVSPSLAPTDPPTVLVPREDTMPFPSAEPTRRPPAWCFSNVDTVRTIRGLVTMDDLRVGDQVLRPDGSYERVYGFGHKHDTTEASFLRIHTTAKDVKPLEITPNHLLFVAMPTRSIPAGDLRVGDAVFIQEEVPLPSSPSSPLRTFVVTNIELVERNGVYGPFTASGTIVVNGVVASTYSSFQDTASFSLAGMDTGLSFHWVSHIVMAPHRQFCAWFDCSDEQYGPDGLVETVRLQLRLWNNLTANQETSWVSAFMIGSILLVMTCVCTAEWIVTGVGLTGAIPQQSDLLGISTLACPIFVVFCVLVLSSVHRLWSNRRKTST